MKILIIEDESLVAKDLERLVHRLEPEAKIVAVVTSVESAKKWFSEHDQPELILADIQLSDGLSFEIFESLHITSPVIFTTAYDEYAIRAFKVNSIDYLLKPIDEHELKMALDKYKSVSTGIVISDQVKALFSQLNKPDKEYKRRFLTLHRNAMIPVTEQEIGYFHKEELIFIHTLKKEKLISDHQTLDEVESLVDPKVFFRVNRQFVVHIQTIARVKATHKGLSVQLAPPFNAELDISREKAAAFKQWVG